MLKHFIKHYKDWTIAILTAALIIVAFIGLSKKPIVTTETIYIPQEVVSERIIQTETIAVPEDALQELVKDALDESFEEVMHHIQELNMQVSLLTRVTAQGRGSTVTERVIEIVDNTVQIKPIDTELAVDFGTAEDPVEVPVASVSLDEEGILEARAYDMGISLTNIVTETEQRSFSTISSLVLTVEGEDYDIPINGQTYYSLWEQPIQEATRRFRLLDPSIDLSIDISFYSNLRLYPGTTLGLSISSLSRGEEDIWRFLRIGVGFSTRSNAYFSLTPVLYNIGNDIPLLQDLWIGPAIGTDTGGNWLIGLTLGTRL